MAWSFDHFLLRFHVSGDSWPLNGKHARGGTESRREEIYRMIVYNWKDSPVEEYDRPSHIASKKQWRLGNASRAIGQELAYLQCNGHLTGSSGHKHNLLGLVRTYQPFEWNMQEGGILYGTRWPWLDYISTGVIWQIFNSVARRAKIWSKSNIWYRQSNITDWSCDETWSHLKPRSRSSISTFAMGGGKLW